MRISFLKITSQAPTLMPEDGSEAKIANLETVLIVKQQVFRLDVSVRHSPIVQIFLQSGQKVHFHAREKKISRGTIQKQQLQQRQHVEQECVYKNCTYMQCVVRYRRYDHLPVVQHKLSSTQPKSVYHCTCFKIPETDTVRSCHISVAILYFNNVLTSFEYCLLYRNLHFLWKIWSKRKKTFLYPPILIPSDHDVT